MDELWPPPSPEVAEAIRSLCQRLVQDADALTDDLAAPALTAQNDPALLSDATLVEEDRHLNRSEIIQWFTSNIQHPGRRVNPYMGPRTTAYIRDLVSRGIAPDFAEGWRAALAVGWRRWLQECVTSCTDPDLLVDVLDVSGKSLVQYSIDSLAALHQVGLDAARGHADADAVAMIQLISSGSPVAEDLAEARLRYRMARSHVGLVLWVDEPHQAGALDETVAAVRAGSADRSTLVARASASSRWIWLSGETPPDVLDIKRVVKESGAVRAVLGRPGNGLEGFRATHQDALAAQAMMIRLGGAVRRFAEYADIELVDHLTKDRDSARRFVVTTLGPLAEADESLRLALLTYVQSGFNATRTAASLYAHRNTVERRVSRANELSAVKVEDNPTHVAAALLVLNISPDILESSPT